MAETGRLRLRHWWPGPGDLQRSPCQRPGLGGGEASFFHVYWARSLDSVSRSSSLSGILPYLFDRITHQHSSDVSRSSKTRKDGNVLETAGCWSGSWSRKKDLERNWQYSNKVLSSVGGIVQKLAGFTWLLTTAVARCYL